MAHGTRSTFEISGERQVINGVDQAPGGLGFRFGRIFHQLPPFRPADAALQLLGRAMTSTSARSEADLPAGYTYFGQFIDHDMSRDLTAGLVQGAPELGQDAVLPPDVIRQGRSPSFDLDSLYGSLTGAVPELLEADGKHMKLGTAAAFGGVPEMIGFDVPRAPSGKALIGDPRNDENLIVQQLHLAFLRFHNAVVDQIDIVRGGESPATILSKARDLVTRHYQWLVVHDFLKRVCRRDVWEAVFGAPGPGSDVWRPDPKVFKVSAAQIPPMPLEFSGAAYRFGHTLVRDDYSWNREFGPGTPFSLFFRFSEVSGSLQGSQNRFPANWIADWRRMFPMEQIQGVKNPLPEDRVNRAMGFDVNLATAMGQIPIKSGVAINLAESNLIRGSRYGLPSGQDVALACQQAGVTISNPLTQTDIQSAWPASGPPIGQMRAEELDTKTPLWFYILAEAQVKEDGKTLGEVGSRIVAETFLALIKTSRTSILFPHQSDPTGFGMFDPASSGISTPQGEALLTLGHLIHLAGATNPLA